jgi:hypothetical protein
MCCAYCKEFFLWQRLLRSSEILFLKSIADQLRSLTTGQFSKSDACLRQLIKRVAQSAFFFCNYQKTNRSVLRGR